MSQSSVGQFLAKVKSFGLSAADDDVHDGDPGRALPTDTLEEFLAGKAVNVAV